MEFLEKLLKASNYFREKLRVRCLPGPEYASVLYSNRPSFHKIYFWNSWSFPSFYMQKSLFSILFDLSKSTSYSSFSIPRSQKNKNTKKKSYIQYKTTLRSE